MKSVIRIVIIIYESIKWIYYYGEEVADYGRQRRFDQSACG